MNRNRKNNKDFKKDINRDVTQTDQKEAAIAKSDKRPNKGRNSNKRNEQRSDRSTDHIGYYSYKEQDFQWYNKIPELIRAAGNVQWVTWLGDPDIDHLSDKVSIPGFMQFNVIPSYGLTYKQTDPLNLSAEKLWSYMFHTVSGNTFADAPDMEIFLLGMVEVYDYIVWLERLYGTVKLWSNESLYFPKNLISAQNVDYDDLASNMADFYGGINQLITQASALCVPKEFTLFQRRAFLFQDYYTEGLSGKSQIYYYAPKGFMTFDIPTTGGAGYLKYNDIKTLWPTPAKYQELIAFGQNMLDFLLNNSEIRKLSSLVLRAWGSDGIIKLAMMPQDYKVNVKFTLEVLEQFKNAVVIPYNAIDDTSLNLTQDPTNVMLQYKPKLIAQPAGTAAYYLQYVQANAALSRDMVPMVTGLPDPGVETNIENSRLMITYKTFGSTKYIVCSSEIVTDVAIGYFRMDGTTQKVTPNTQTFNTFMSKTVPNNVTTGQATTNLLAAQFDAFLISCFKFHPAYGISILQQANAGAVSYNLPALDFDNYTWLSPAQIEKMANACMYNLTYSDTVAKAWNGR